MISNIYANFANFNWFRIGETAIVTSRLGVECKSKHRDSVGKAFNLITSATFLS